MQEVLPDLDLPPCVKKSDAYLALQHKIDNTKYSQKGRRRWFCPICGVHREGRSQTFAHMKHKHSETHPELTLNDVVFLHDAEYYYHCVKDLDMKARNPRVSKFIRGIKTAICVEDMKEAWHNDKRCREEELLLSDDELEFPQYKRQRGYKNKRLSITNTENGQQQTFVLNCVNLILEPTLRFCPVRISTESGSSTDVDVSEIFPPAPVHSRSPGSPHGYLKTCNTAGM